LFLFETHLSQASSHYAVSRASRVLTDCVRYGVIKISRQGDVFVDVVTLDGVQSNDLLANGLILS